MATAEERARDLLAHLPPELPTPEWINEANGVVGLDWNVTEPHRQVSADVSPTKIEVAALIDRVTSHYTLSYGGGDVPTKLLELLRRLTAPV